MDYKKIYFENAGEYESIHHIDLNHNNNSLNNLISLNRTVHSKVHEYIDDMRALNIVSKKIELTMQKYQRLIDCKSEKEFINISLTPFKFIVPKMGTTFKEDLIVEENPKENLQILLTKKEKIEEKLKTEYKGLKGALTVAFEKKKQGLIKNDYNITPISFSQSYME